MTQNQIITVTARKNMVRARAGEIQLPKIVGFVFGDGGEVFIINDYFFVALH